MTLFESAEDYSSSSNDDIPVGTLKENIIKISDEILSYLLHFKKSHPDFTFSLRSRDSTQSEEKRLEKGFWFQGSDYIIVPLFKRGDNKRRIKTIGFVLTFESNGKIRDNYIQLSFKTIDDEDEINFYKHLASEIGIELTNDKLGQKTYADPKKYLENLQDYITNFREAALHGLHMYDLNEIYIITENEFQKPLLNILRLKNNTITEPMDFVTDKPLNQILFGPPGTGKTYNTINKSLEIIAEEEERNLNWTDRAIVKAQFDKRVNDGRIVFTTFHQSMSYEDFIEGIKPIKPLPESTFLKYDIEPGIFYNICATAKSNFENAKLENKEKLNFEDAFELFKEEWEQNPTMKFPLKTEGFDYTIIGFTNYSIQFKKASGGTSHTLSIGTLKELYYGKEYNFKQGVGIYYPAVLKKVLSYQTNKQNTAKLNNYVIIIDEINRGNISQIFGELITLIEEDKRLGKDESLQALLPYSKEMFGVPPNLYIIGTMNTADRSVEALDAALRRRFSFEEIVPQPLLIASEGKLKATNGKIESIELPNLLMIINKRIEKLLDKDHQIGHSYFMNVTDLKSLQTVFQNKIIPLLQEYFFGDFGKIGLVLGKGFFEDFEKPDDNIFADFDDYDASGFSERPVYKIKNIVKMSTNDFNVAIATLLK